MGKVWETPSEAGQGQEDLLVPSVLDLPIRNACGIFTFSSALWIHGVALND